MREPSGEKLRSPRPEPTGIPSSLRCWKSSQPPNPSRATRSWRIEARMNAFCTTILLAVTLGGSAYAADWPAEDLWYKCKGCHGMDGKANTKIGVKEKIPDLTSPTWQAQMSDEQIKKLINNGSEKNSKMKAYKEIF